MNMLKYVDNVDIQKLEKCDDPQMGLKNYTSV
jgi:hypothetical protein